MFVPVLADLTLPPLKEESTEESGKKLYIYTHTRIYTYTHIYKRKGGARRVEMVKNKIKKIWNSFSLSLSAWAIHHSVGLN